MFIGHLEDNLSLIINCLRFAILARSLVKRNEATDLVSGLILISILMI